MPFLLVLLLFMISVPLPAAAQAARSDGTVAIPPAVAQPVLTHDETGHAVVRATRIRTPLKLDGRLDDEAYLLVPPISDFIQQDPDQGQPISERTDAWVLFDNKYLYIVCRCWDSHPERIVANDMRRDSTNIRQGDNFAVSLDTFGDHRNGYLFYGNPVGGLFDGVITDERQDNTDWNALLEAGTGRFDGGWILELAIPFTSLRYKPGAEQTWGIQFRRAIPSKNERAFLTPVSRAWGGAAVNHVSAGATLVGLEPPPGSTGLELKPYAISQLTTDTVGPPIVDDKFKANAGMDMKYGLTKGLALDLTFNTDFAQVEADEAQVNLSRFNLFFPEKREFFLEGKGIFTFGRSSVSGEGGGGGDDDVPTLFHSRRIALSGSQSVPLIAGGRITGKAGPWSVGLVNIETGEDPIAKAAETNFTVLRLRRDLLRRSAVGGILTGRSVASTGSGGNYVAGVDGTFAFYQNIFVGGYIAQSFTEGRTGHDVSYRGQFNYNGDRYGLGVDRVVVEPNFNADVGFMRRNDFRRSSIGARFSPRPVSGGRVRRWIYEGALDYVTDNDNRLESREQQVQFGAEFDSGDTFSVKGSRAFEYVPARFRLTDTVGIPVGRYSFDNVVLSYTAGAQRRISGALGAEFGNFYDGDKKTASYKGRVEVTPKLGIEPNLSLNWIDLPQGAFTTTVVGGRATFTMTPRMFVSALVQYASSNTSVSANLRFRWEYQPGSEFFVVYTEGRDTLPVHGTLLENRGLVVKATRLFRR